MTDVDNFEGEIYIILYIYQKPSAFNEVVDIFDISFCLCHMVNVKHRSRLSREAGSPTSGVKIWSILMLRKNKSVKGANHQFSASSNIDGPIRRKQQLDMVGSGRCCMYICVCQGAIKLTKTTLHSLSSLQCSRNELQNHQHDFAT